MMILVSHIRYRSAVDAGRLRASSFPAPGGALFSWVALLFLIGVTGMVAFDEAGRISLYVAAVWALGLAVGWQVLKRNNPQIAERAAQREYAAKSD
jgi:AAT family amino acid transporter